LRRRPARLIADAAGRTQIIGIAEAAHPFAEGRHFQRKFSAAGTRTGNRVNADEISGLLDRTGFQARLLCLGPPGFTFRGHETTAATRQRNEDKGADYEPTNSTRHPRTFTEDN
jgi:hypothetical protein